MIRLGIKNLAFVMVSVLLLISLVGCAPWKTEEELPVVTDNNLEIQITDDYGIELVLARKPEKIISLAPNITEILFALGLGEKVIGVTSYCVYPKEALDVENVSDFVGNNLERIIELNPELVITYGIGNEAENTILREAGINVIGFEPESIDQVIDVINRIGKVTGRDEKAKGIVENMIIERDEILSKIKNAEKVKVFYEVWHEPIMAAEPGSYMDYLVTLAGGENISVDGITAYPKFDLAQLVEGNPDVYLTSDNIPEKSVESIISRQGFENIKAVKNRKVHILDTNIVSRPGPRIVEALEVVAKAIHPELFK